jgi:hypothetical protein
MLAPFSIEGASSESGAVHSEIASRENYARYCDFYNDNPSRPHCARDGGTSDVVYSLDLPSTEEAA